MTPVRTFGLTALSLALLAAALLLAASPARAGAFEEMIASYEAAGAGPFDAARGEAMWTEPHLDAETGKKRDCTACHTADLAKVGKHQKTGKVIDPLAPSVTPDRLTEVKKIKKWFKRNCDWTYGRPCTPQEQGDFLMYIKSQ